MNKNLNLEILLDNDQLNVSQQREIRRLIEYRFEKKGNAYGFYFSPNKTGIEIGYGLDLTNLELTKKNMYKHVMTGILTLTTKLLDDDTAIYEIKSLLKKVKDGSGRSLLFKDGYYVINDNLDNKAQSLYKAVMIIKNQGLLS